MYSTFKQRLRQLSGDYESLIASKNIRIENGNGIFNRFEHPVLTAAHTPLLWRYDLDETKNPFLLQRIGINAVFNSGAIRFNNKYILLARVEGEIGRAHV